jgi:hypothetical protein
VAFRLTTMRALLALLAVGTAYELADDLKALPTGDAPGDGPAGGGFFVGVPSLALLLSGFALIYVAGREGRLPLAWLVAPLGAAFMLAHFYSYDDYCGGYGCRIAQEVSRGAAHWAWILATAGLAAGILSRRTPRPGLLLTSAVAILCALTVLFVPFGH